MSVMCEVCLQSHDHNIMEHIYQLEYTVEELNARLEDLEGKNVS